MRSSEMRATVQAANRFTPNGGVIMPSARLTTITRPKCTGSMPKCSATGANMGASTMMAALVSMNMPITNSAALMPSKNMAGRLQHLLQPVADGIGHAGARDQERKQPGVGDDEHDHRAAHHRLAQDRHQILELDLAVDHHAHQQRIEHRHRRGLGGREDAAVDAAQDDHRHQQRPARLDRGVPTLKRPSPSFLPQPLYLQYT